MSATDYVLWRTGVRSCFFAMLVAACAAQTAVAQDAALRSLENGIDAKAWEAVGRLDINGTGFCTGALITPKLVLTAAHCLFDKTTSRRLDGAKIEFLAGWRNGRAGAYRDVARAVVHPDYIYEAEPNPDRVRNDLALLELSHPIRNTSIRPFKTAARPHTGDLVGVVSYAQDRAEAPALQEQCKVLARQEGVLVTSCSANFGASGAPIFVFDGKEAQIVSVVSAMAEVGGEAVSLGTALDEPLAVLQEGLVAGETLRMGAGSENVRIKVGNSARKTGAKFVKP